MPASRLCAGCGGPFPLTALRRGRCPACLQLQTRRYDQAKRTRRPRPSYSEDQRRAAAVAEHRATVGDWCPGVPELGRPAHPAANLSADHVIPVNGRPWLESGPLVVRCIPCNAARGARTPAGGA